jgi:hypothetical protein
MLVAPETVLPTAVVSPLATAWPYIVSELMVTKREDEQLRLGCSCRLPMRTLLVLLVVSALYLEDVKLK